MEEARAAILRLGTRRFGPATEETKAAIEAIQDRVRLERTLDRVLDATGWDDLVATA